jgi:hypothetical protein
VSALTVEHARPLTAATPALRRRPIPVGEPRSATRVVRGVGPRSPGATPATGQQALLLDARPGTAEEADTQDRATEEAKQWAAQFIQAALEVAAGTRPGGQLARWATEEVCTALVRRGLLSAARAHTARVPRRTVVSSRASCPRPGVAEASAVITDGRRMRAVALRMESRQGRWRVTALQIG